MLKGTKSSKPNKPKQVHINTKLEEKPDTLINTINLVLTEEQTEILRNYKRTPEASRPKRNTLLPLFPGLTKLQLCHALDKITPKAVRQKSNMTQELAETIRLLYEPKKIGEINEFSIVALSRRFGASPPTVSKIVRNKIWVKK